VNEQVGGAARNLAGQVRVGLPLHEAVAEVARDTPAPFGGHLRRTALMMAQGIDLGIALGAMRDRCRVDAVTALAIALQVAEERGGRLADVLDRIAHTAEEITRVERKREADTASGRLMVTLLAVFPVAFLGFVALLDPAITGAALLADWHSGPTAGLVMLLALLALASAFVAKEVRDRAAARMRAIRGRIPYTLDLMALVLEAGGGTLFDCLRLGAEENAGHPLGDEYRRVVNAIEKGVAPTDALGEMTRRLAAPDAAEVNLAIVTAETRGLPLRDALQSVALRIRSRQVQWMERAAEEAKVHITWPAMTVMVACLTIVVAPFLVNAVSNGR
jgi:Flp pilus assembly protein TadB